MSSPRGTQSHEQTLREREYAEQDDPRRDEYSEPDSQRRRQSPLQRFLTPEVFKQLGAEQADRGRRISIEQQQQRQQ